MLYLKSFRLPGIAEEDAYLLGSPWELTMSCYPTSIAYPFKLFVNKGLSRIDFEPITIFYGGNGSGKSTLLSVIAKKLSIPRTAPSQSSQCFDAYVDLCRAEMAPRVKKIPKESRMLTSESVFDLLLDGRSLNSSIEEERQAIFDEYKKTRETPYADSPFLSFDDLEELKRRREAWCGTKNAYTVKRLSAKEAISASNGECAFKYFTDRIDRDALYILDEPENSLSPELVLELSDYLESAVRFFGCQLIIATHSPFLLAMKGAKVYDLDTLPVVARDWRELRNVKIYFEFFSKHAQG